MKRYRNKGPGRFRLLVILGLVALAVALTLAPIALDTAIGWLALAYSTVAISAVLLWRFEDFEWVHEVPDRLLTRMFALFGLTAVRKRLEATARAAPVAICGVVMRAATIPAAMIFGGNRIRDQQRRGFYQFAPRSNISTPTLGVG